MIDLLLIFSLIAVIVTTCGLIVGTTIDDFRDVKRRRLFKAHPYSRKYRSRPLVTVLLIAGSDSDVTKDALNHLRKNPYRRLEFIIIGNVRQRAKLKRLATSLTRLTRPVHVFSGKQSEQSNLDAAYQRYGHGDIVLTLRDTDRLDVAAIKRGIWHFNTQGDIARLGVRTAISTRYSSLGLLQTYTYALIYFWNKLANSLEYSHVPDNADVSFYRAEAFLARHSYTRLKTYSAEDIVAHQPAASNSEFITHISAMVRQGVSTLASVHDPARRHQLIRWPLLLFLTCLGYLCVAMPLLITYFLFLALVPHQPALLFISIAILIIYLLIGLWSHTGMSRLQKTRLSLLTPAYFVPFYALTAICCTITIATTMRTIRTSLSSLAAARGEAPLR